MEDIEIVKEKIAIREIYKAFTAIGEGVPRLTRESERELAALRDSGDQDAAMTMARSLVNLIVHRQQKRYRHYDSNILGDALSDALMRTVRAAELFDPDNGVQFSSYASLFIDGALADAGRKHVEDIHVGSTARYDSAKLEKFRYNFEFRNGRMPTQEEIEAELKFKASRVERLEEVSLLHMDSAPADPEGGEPYESSVEPEAFDLIAEAQQEEKVQRARSAMTGKQLEAFDLLRGGMGWNDVKASLGITSGALQRRVDGAKAKVAKELLGE